jgi:hypothetical protein
MLYEVGGDVGEIGPRSKFWECLLSRSDLLSRRRKKDMLRGDESETGSDKFVAGAR